jgi:S1-C subfamily serine protease
MKFSLLLLPALAIAAPFGSTAEQPIDDAQIFQRLDREVGALAESGKAPLGREERLKQAARRTTTVSKLLAPSSHVLSKEDLYTRAAASTVLFGTAFKCEKCTRWHSAMASGVIIDPSGIVATNYHVAVAAKGDAMGVMLSDGTFLPVTEILAADQKQDVALVRIQTGDKT